MLHGEARAIKESPDGPLGQKHEGCSLSFLNTKPLAIASWLDPWPHETAWTPPARLVSTRWEKGKGKINPQSSQTYPTHSVMESPAVQDLTCGSLQLPAAGDGPSWT